MRRIIGITALLAAAGCAGPGAGAGAGAAGGAAAGAANGATYGITHGDPALIAKIDSIVEAPIKAGKVAGASIAVVKGTDTIAVQGFGKASVELDVPTPPHAIYQIGSVTKQFTAAAIMQLVSEGKINLDDDFTKYYPGFNPHGRKITVRQLLNHTSGIKGYTEIPEFRLIGMQHLPKDTLLRIIEKKPFDFEPGAEETYNNTAFFLAGLIIEKVSGMSYTDYVQKNLFDKAGMKDAHYCSERALHPRDVEGYDTDSTGLIQKGYLDHTWPFAAGSLCSSAIDLVAWDQALHGGKILDPATYQEFIKPGELTDGTQLRYAKGLAISKVLGRRALHHGGGINGFLSENIYFPDDSLAVVVLFNTAGPVGPDPVARAIAEAVLGPAPDESKPFEGDLAQFAGTYTGNGRGRPTELTIAVDAGKLMAKMPFADSAQALVYLGNDTFGGAGDAHFIFKKQGDKVVGVDLDVAYGYNKLKKK